MNPNSKSKKDWNDLIQNFVILVLVVSLIVLTYNNRRLSQALNDHTPRIVTIPLPIDYEKEISEKFDSIRTYVDTVDYDTTYSYVSRYLDELIKQGTTYKRHVPNKKSDTSSTRTSIKTRDY